MSLTHYVARSLAVLFALYFIEHWLIQPFTAVACKCGVSITKNASSMAPARVHAAISELNEK